MAGLVDAMSKEGMNDWGTYQYHARENISFWWKMRKLSGMAMG